MAEAAKQGLSAQAILKRYFFSIAAGVLAVFMWIGYYPFYLHLHSGFTRQPIVDDLVAYAIPHGVVATAWILALILQPFLIGKRMHQLHKTIGWYLLGLATLLVISGALIAVKGASLAPEDAVHGITYRQFIIVMLTEMVAFVALVTTAVLNRKKPHIHRAMMLLTGIAILSAATDRTPWIQALTGHQGWWGMFAPELLLGLLFLGARWALTGRFDRWLGGGLAALMAALWLAFQLAPTAAWDGILTGVFGV